MYFRHLPAHKGFFNLIKIKRTNKTQLQQPEWRVIIEYMNFIHIGTLIFENIIHFLLCCRRMYYNFVSIVSKWFLKQSFLLIFIKYWLDLGEFQMRIKCWVCPHFITISMIENQSDVQTGDLKNCNISDEIPIYIVIGI